MTTEARKDCKFYVSLACAMVLVFVGVFCPPIGEIADSLLWAFFGLLALDCAILGLDVQGIIREIRLLKQASITSATQSTNNDGEVLHDK